MIRLISLGDLPDGAVVSVQVENTKGRPVALVIFRRGQDYIVYENRCPHAGMAFNARGTFLISKDDHLVCAAHGAVFDVKSGTCLGGPGQGNNLSRLETTVQDDVLCLNDRP